MRYAGEMRASLHFRRNSSSGVALIHLIRDSIRMMANFTYR